MVGGLDLGALSRLRWCQERLKHLPMLACLPDTSPNCTNLRARRTRFSTLSKSLLLRPLACWHPNSSQRDHPNVHSGTMPIVFQGIKPPRQGRNKNMRGTKRKSFHTRTWRATSFLSNPNFTPSMACLNADLCSVEKLWDTLHDRRLELEHIRQINHVQ